MKNCSLKPRWPRRTFKSEENFTTTFGDLVIIGHGVEFPHTWPVVSISEVLYEVRDWLRRWGEVWLLAAVSLVRFLLLRVSCRLIRRLLLILSMSLKRWPLSNLWLCILLLKLSSTDSLFFLLPFVTLLKMSLRFFMPCFSVLSIIHWWGQQSCDFLPHWLSWSKSNMLKLRKSNLISYFHLKIWYETI